MKIGAVPENLSERRALKAGIVPIPLVESVSLAKTRVVMAAVLLDFMFAMTSASKTWSEAEIAGWQKEAGLAPREPIYFPGSRDYGQQAAVKPSAAPGLEVLDRPAPHKAP